MMFNFIIGKKLNMSVRFDEEGRRLPVTIIEAGPCLVAGMKTLPKDGYEALVLEYVDKKKKVLKEFRVNGLEQVKIGEVVKVDNFKAGDLVKVTGISKGKGFAGVVKRWGFAGGPKTHGQSDRHRAPGSIGAGTTPGRVYKGKKMAGRMGGEKVTVRNLQVVEVNPEKNWLVVKGSIHGHFRSTVFIEKLTPSSSQNQLPSNSSERLISRQLPS